MKNIPDYIYLQVDPDREDPEDYNNLKGVTFSVDRINDNDIMFIRGFKNIPQSIKEMANEKPY